MNSITIHFEGICTHITTGVDGVPHRVVLVQAQNDTQFGGGRVVPAHIGRVEIPADARRIGDRYDLPLEFVGIRMTIKNAIEGVQYDALFKTQIWHLTEVTPGL